MVVLGMVVQGTVGVYPGNTYIFEAVLEFYEDIADEKIVLIHFPKNGNNFLQNHIIFQIC
jgi:hypothetical protein